jgi:hypothetical protein
VSGRMPCRGAGRWLEGAFVTASRGSFASVEKSAETARAISIFRQICGRPFVPLETLPGERSPEFSGVDRGTL